MFNVPFGQFLAPNRPLTPSHAAMSQRTERLRRTGYADGDRQPRLPRHWANR